MNKKDKSPIFIHSLFRSGSTYLFNVFRRSNSGYWCYQEPLNEHLLLLDTNQMQEVGKEMARYLNHPQIDKPYYYEFQMIAGEIKNTFPKELSYYQYFLPAGSDVSNLKDYFTFLSNRAQGRPVFQCCRTSGRTACLKTEFGGVHIFLWRHPWNQWWSYKIDNYFDQRNLLIANAQNIPPFLTEVISDLELEQFNSWEKVEQQTSLNRNRLDAPRSYKLFYALWCHAFLEAKPSCDIAINIDQLSYSDYYRKDILNNLDNLGVQGIDFSDCDMPQSIYVQSETGFYNEIEQEIHDLLVKHGYSQYEMKELRALNEERISLAKVSQVDKNLIVSKEMTARKIVKRYEAELSNAMSNLSEVETKIKEAEAKVEQAEAKVEQANGKTDQAEVLAQQAESKVNQVESKLEMLYRSHSWRITAPLRSIMNFLKNQ